MEILVVEDEASQKLRTPLTVPARRSSPRPAAVAPVEIDD
jgi:hypothetical protein